ncbi:hypothetical protein MNEG_1130, partial [Monoraphidium neglectum]
MQQPRQQQESFEQHPHGTRRGSVGGSNGGSWSGGGGGVQLPPGGWGPRDPAACGHPKDKISLHRRGNRRRIYYKKPQGLLAHC